MFTADMKCQQLIFIIYVQKCATETGNSTSTSTSTSASTSTSTSIDSSNSRNQLSEKSTTVLLTQTAIQTLIPH